MWQHQYAAKATHFRQPKRLKIDAAEKTRRKKTIFIISLIYIYIYMVVVNDAIVCGPP